MTSTEWPWLTERTHGACCVQGNLVEKAAVPRLPRGPE